MNQRRGDFHPTALITAPSGGPDYWKENGQIREYVIESRGISETLKQH